MKSALIDIHSMWACREIYRSDNVCIQLCVTTWVGRFRRVKLALWSVKQTRPLCLQLFVACNSITETGSEMHRHIVIGLRRSTSIRLKQMYVETDRERVCVRSPAPYSSAPGGVVFARELPTYQYSRNKTEFSTSLTSAFGSVRRSVSHQAPATLGTLARPAPVS